MYVSLKMYVYVCMYRNARYTYTNMSKHICIYIHTYVGIYMCRFKPMYVCMGMCNFCIRGDSVLLCTMYVLVHMC